jgi:hypothetical protein
MPSQGGFQVNVLEVPSGIPFAEYKPKGSNLGNECYIESKLGVCFAIEVIFDPSRFGPLIKSDTTTASSYVAQIYVDGKRVVNKLLGKVGDKDIRECRTAGLEVEAGKMVPFVFGETRFTGALSLFGLELI